MSFVTIIIAVFWPRLWVCYFFLRIRLILPMNNYWSVASETMLICSLQLFGWKSACFWHRIKPELSLSISNELKYKVDLIPVNNCDHLISNLSIYRVSGFLKDCHLIFLLSRFLMDGIGCTSLMTEIYR